MNCNPLRPLSLPALLCTAALLAFGSAAHASNFSKAAYSDAKSDIKANYKAERKTCDGMSGNAKDVCIEEVKGRESVALAQLEYNYSGSAKDQEALYRTQADARYDVAKEKCDDRSGDAKDLCLREAKTTHEKARADLKLAHKVNDAAEDAADARRKADYKLASEKCDSLAGDRKDGCMASAKARYGER